jgi:hypothetical protein
MKRPTDSHPLTETLENLRLAFSQWDAIPDGAESEADKIKKKTKELLIKLSEQIKALDL